MKRKIIVLKVLVPLSAIFLCGTVFATETISQSSATAPQQYIDFVTGSVADKTKLLSNLSISDDTPELVVSIPEEALEFVQDKVPLLGTGSGMKELALAAIPVLQVASQRQGALLWNIFVLFDDSQIKVAVLDALSVAVSKNKRLVSPYLEGIHTFVAESTATDSDSLASSIAAIKLLGLMADPNSFEILFRLMNSKVSPELDNAIESSLALVIPSAQPTLLRHISQDYYSMAEKYGLFLIVQKNDKISSLFKAELAEKALSATIIKTEDVSKMAPEALSLQLAAVQQIDESDWTRAASIVAEYFVQAQQQFNLGLITREQFLGVVTCLEGLATSHSVSALVNYLGVLNTAAAQKVSSVDEEVLLAVIESLGALGDKAAFDNLLYVTYLPYPETITTAARTALAGLKW